MRYVLLAVVAGILAIGVLGCAPMYPTYVGVPVPVSQKDIIDMTEAGATDEEIIREIDDTQALFKLTVNDVNALKEAGVSEGVVNHMLDTPNRRVRVVNRYYYDPSYYSWYDPWYDSWYDPWYYGYGYSYRRYRRYPRVQFNFGWYHYSGSGGRYYSRGGHHYSRGGGRRH